MSLLLSGPTLFFDDDEIEAVVLDFSDRIRRDAILRPTLSRLIGNDWAAAEAAALSFLHVSLLADGLPSIDANWLARAMCVLEARDLERLAEIFLDSALSSLPLQSAAVVSGVAEELLTVLRDVVSETGVRRQRQILQVHARLATGALSSGW